MLLNCKIIIIKKQTVVPDGSWVGYKTHVRSSDPQSVYPILPSVWIEYIDRSEIG